MTINSVQSAQTPPARLPVSNPADGAPASLQDLVFLSGTWSGGGASPAHGQGTGPMEFDPQPDGKALYRTNAVDYADGFKHRDWTKIAPDPKTGQLMADYQDNEGFAIHYSKIDVSQSPQTAIFESDASPTQPAFRFTYQVANPTTIHTTFELQNHDHWSTVAGGDAHRVG